MKVIRLSALRTGRLYPQEIFLVLISVKRLSQPQGHTAAGRIMTMKISIDTIGNRTCDLPACSAVPQPTAPPRAPFTCVYVMVYSEIKRNVKVPSYVRVREVSLRPMDTATENIFRNNSLHNLSLHVSCLSCSVPVTVGCNIADGLAYAFRPSGP
jgi:hypothetical protein